jgi:enoyl-CoA hydratase/carnithine racemase
MTDGILSRETRGYIRILTINRPERSNAMSPELTEELIDAFVDAGADPEVRVIVLTAVGDRAFCAGADLKAAAQSDALEWRSGRSCRECDDTFSRWYMRPSNPPSPR